MLEVRALPPELLLSARPRDPARPGGPGSRCRPPARGPHSRSSSRRAVVPNGSRSGGVPGGDVGRRGRPLVDESPPHVDGVTGEEGPLEDVGPAELVPVERPMELPDTQGHEPRHDDEDDGVQREGAPGQPDVGGRPALRGGGALAPGSISLRSPAGRRRSLRSGPPAPAGGRLGRCGPRLPRPPPGPPAAAASARRHRRRPRRTRPVPARA